ncbi:MAG: sugar phosphate nucleotidyltransferase [Dehalococcoidales bacterium]
MKAVLLAAGAGTRCYPFTYLAPKIFQQVGGIPLVEYMLSWFGGAPEIDELYIAVRDNATAATLQDYVGKRKQYLDQILRLFHKLGYHVDYTNPDFNIQVIQTNGWGTGGDLRCALDQMAVDDSEGDDFLVCYADYIINRTLPDGTISLQMNLSDIIQYHERCNKSIGTVMTVAFVVVEREEATRFGVGKLEDLNGCKVVRGFIEKPGIDEIDEEPAINAGVCIIKSQFLLPDMDKFLPRQPDTSLERNLMEQLAREEKPMLAAYLLDLDAWFDVGTLEQLINTNIFIASKKE